MLNSIRERLIHFYYARGTSRPLIRKLLHKDPSLTSIYSMTSTDWHQTFQLPIQRAQMLFQDLHSNSILQRINSDMMKYGVITIVDEIYPPMLKPIKDAPIVLYTMGDVNLLQQVPAISVIGTRKPSAGAWETISHIIAPLVKEDWVIVSGMAKGIDSFAHRVALKYHGNTIAVLGSGFNHIYPRENKTLAVQIAQNGLVISEYPPHIAPKPYHFPERNRIISGLSFGTLVIEAALKSGTLITVEQALDQGREVYAIPGSPLIKQTEGCHKMIQEGAKLVHQTQDLKEDWERYGHLWAQFQYNK